MTTPRRPPRAANNCPIRRGHGATTPRNVQREDMTFGLRRFVRCLWNWDFRSGTLQSPRCLPTNRRAAHRIPSGPLDIGLRDSAIPAGLAGLFDLASACCLSFGQISSQMGRVSGSARHDWRVRECQSRAFPLLTRLENQHPYISEYEGKKNQKSNVPPKIECKPQTNEKQRSSCGTTLKPQPR